MHVIRPDSGVKTHALSRVFQLPLQASKNDDGDDDEIDEDEDEDALSRVFQLALAGGPCKASKYHNE